MSRLQMPTRDMHTSATAKALAERANVPMLCRLLMLCMIRKHLGSNDMVALLRRSIAVHVVRAYFRIGLGTIMKLGSRSLFMLQRDRTPIRQLRADMVYALH